MTAVDPGSAVDPVHWGGALRPLRGGCAARLPAVCFPAAGRHQVP